VTGANTAANTAAVGAITAGSVSTTINSGGGVATNQVATVSMLANAASKEAYVNTGFFYLTTGVEVTCASMTYVKDDATTALRVAASRQTTIATNADAAAEAARQLAFLGGPLVEDEHLLVGQWAPYLGQVIILTIDQLGYDAGVAVFVIGVQDDRASDTSRVSVLRRL
jgi:hypothetical protein